MAHGYLSQEVDPEEGGYFWLYKKYAWHWLATLAVISLYLVLIYLTPLDGCPLGSTTPQCNAAFYWDTKIVGVAHMYKTPTYNRLPECSSCSPGDCPIPGRPDWCMRPFDPEGTISSLSGISPR